MQHLATSRHRSLLLLALAAGGCLMDGSVSVTGNRTGAQRSPSVDLRGLSLDSASDGYLSGAFSLGAATVRFEARRGAATPADVTSADSSAPSHEIDARFVAENGDTFAARIGGHSFGDPRWTADANAPHPSPDEAQRRIDFDTARAAAEALARETVNLDVADLRDALIELGRSPASVSPPIIAPAPSPAGVGTAASGLVSGAYTHRFEIWTKSVTYRGYTTPAQHSSTRTRSLSATGTQMYLRVTCNHGTCAGASTMVLACQTGYGGRAAALPSFSNCETTQVGENYCTYGCCATAYSITWGGHLCHDDTMYQRDVIHAWPSNIGYPAYCSSRGFSWWAPSCLAGNGG